MIELKRLEPHHVHFWKISTSDILCALLSLTLVTQGIAKKMGDSSSAADIQHSLQELNQLRHDSNRWWDDLGPIESAVIG